MGQKGRRNILRRGEGRGEGRWVLVSGSPSPGLKSLQCIDSSRCVGPEKKEASSILDRHRDESLRLLSYSQNGSRNRTKETVRCISVEERVLQVAGPSVPETPEKAISS